jgi:isoamylase
LLAQGVPMLLAGDEQGRTQAGNNNAYCQDNPGSWMDWGKMNHALCGFAARLIELRRSHPSLRRVAWFDGSLSPLGERDIAWLWRDGNEIEREQWEDGTNRCFGFRLGRNSADEAALLVLINAGGNDVAFTLPPPPGGLWQLQLDTARNELVWASSGGTAASTAVPAHGLLVFSSAPGAV